MVSGQQPAARTRRGSKRSTRLRAWRADQGPTDPPRRPTWASSRYSRKRSVLRRRPAEFLERNRAPGIGRSCSSSSASPRSERDAQLDVIKAGVAQEDCRFSPTTIPIRLRRHRQALSTPTRAFTKKLMARPDPQQRAAVDAAPRLKCGRSRRRRVAAQAGAWLRLFPRWLTRCSSCATLGTPSRFAQEMDDLNPMMARRTYLPPTTKTSPLFVRRNPADALPPAAAKVGHGSPRERALLIPVLSRKGGLPLRDACRSRSCLSIQRLHLDRARSAQAPWR